MKKLFPVAIIAAVLSTGCTQYLEQPTPAGAVPPPVPSAQYRVEDGVRNAYSAEVLETSDLQAETVLADFIKSYQKAGSPKIVVFFNRQLSEDTKDWTSNRRLLIDNLAALNVDVTSSKYGGDKTINAASHDTRTVSVQTKTNNSSQVRLVDDWAWEFEDNFLNEFLKAGVNIVDRNTIIRLSGFDISDNMSDKFVETQALKNYSDLFLEILFTKANRAKGYNISVKLKDVNTGELIALTTLNNTSDSDETETVEYVATSRGFQPRKKATKSGTVMALRLMKNITNKWN